jgi:hypothetical protein
MSASLILCCCAIKPGMATIPGAMLLCASSPHARCGALWEAYRKHYGQDDAPVLVWQAATRDMNSIVAAELCHVFRRSPRRIISYVLVDVALRHVCLLDQPQGRRCRDPGLFGRNPGAVQHYAGDGTDRRDAQKLRHPQRHS